jgi:hypothetical protein
MSGVGALQRMAVDVDVDADTIAGVCFASVCRILASMGIPALQR